MCLSSTSEICKEIWRNIGIEIEFRLEFCTERAKVREQSAYDWQEDGERQKDMKTGKRSGKKQIDFPDILIRTASLFEVEMEF